MLSILAFLLNACVTQHEPSIEKQVSSSGMSVVAGSALSLVKKEMAICVTQYAIGTGKMDLAIYYLAESNNIKYSSEDYQLAGFVQQCAGYTYSGEGSDKGSIIISQNSAS